MSPERCCRSDVERSNVERSDVGGTRSPERAKVNSHGRQPVDQSPTRNQPRRGERWPCGRLPPMPTRGADTRCNHRSRHGVLTLALSGCPHSSRGGRTPVARVFKPWKCAKGILARQGERNPPGLASLMRQEIHRPMFHRTDRSLQAIVRPAGRGCGGGPCPGFENPGNARMPSKRRIASASKAARH